MWEQIVTPFFDCYPKQTKTLLNEGHISFRAPPANLRVEDRYLFEHEFQKEIPENHLLRLSSAVVMGNDIFGFPFKLYRQYTSAVCHTVSLREKSKLFIKIALRKSRQLDKAVWITDEWSNGFFHWMTDALPRLEACTAYMNGHAVLLPMRYSKIRFVQESLTLLQVPVIYYDKAFPLWVNEILVPSHTAPTGNFNKKFIHGVRSRLITQTSNETSSNRVYISRKKAERRRITNENEVEAILGKYGCITHCMEDYSLLEQIKIMSKANILVGLHGSGLANMIFMSKRSKIIEIRTYGDTHNNCYFALASELDHQYFYIESQADSKNGQDENVTVDLGVLESVLRLLIP